MFLTLKPGNHPAALIFNKISRPAENVIRRECVDHIIVLGEVHLRTKY
jgi:hypothetical protein